MSAVTTPSVSLSTAPHGRGWLHYGGCVMLTAALFALLAPGVGAFLFFVAPALVESAMAGALTWDSLPSAFTGAVMVAFWFAYAHSALAAAFAGFWTAILSSFVNGPLKFYPAIAVIGALAGQVSLVNLPASDGQMFVLFGVMGAVAAMITAFLLRALRLHPDSDSIFARQFRRDRLAKARAERLRLQRVEEAKERGKR